MKYLLLVFLIPFSSFAQYTALEEFFFGRVPGARAEAMGKAFAAVDGDMTSVFYNPAGTASTEGLALNGSYATPYYMLKDANYLFTGAGYRIKDYLFIGVSTHQLYYGTLPFLFNDDGNFTTTEGELTAANYTLNISSHINNWMTGININYLTHKSPFTKTDGFYFDAGIIKQIELFSADTGRHKLNLAASVINFSHSKPEGEYDNNNFKMKLPVTTRIAASYIYKDKSRVFDKLDSFQFLFQLEYKLLLNSKFLSGTHTGAEILLLEIIALRCGYYKEKFGFSDFTYGAGLQLPFYKLSKIPLNINFDYTSLPQPSSDIGFSKTWDNFSTFTLRINWRIGIKNNSD